MPHRIGFERKDGKYIYGWIMAVHFLITTHRWLGLVLSDDSITYEVDMLARKER